MVRKPKEKIKIPNKFKQKEFIVIFQNGRIKSEGWIKK